MPGRLLQPAPTAATVDESWAIPADTCPSGAGLKAGGGAAQSALSTAACECARESPVASFSFAPTPVAPPPPKPNVLTVSRDTDSGSLSVAVAVPPARPELADPEPVEETRIIGWGIQVGSFEKRASAHRAARNARVVANDILSHQPAQLRQISYGNLTLWQVHFSGFDETLARQACLQLFQKGMSCIAIPQISQSS